MVSIDGSKSWIWFHFRSNPVDKLKFRGDIKTTASFVVWVELLLIYQSKFNYNKLLHIISPLQSKMMKS